MDKNEIASWVLRGSSRRIIFKLIEDIKIPAQLFQEANQINEKISRNNVSDILKEFKDKDLVECLNEEDKRGRMYTLTSLGKKIKNLI